MGFKMPAHASRINPGPTARGGSNKPSYSTVQGWHSAQEAEADGSLLLQDQAELQVPAQPGYTEKCFLNKKKIKSSNQDSCLALLYHFFVM